MVKNKKLLFYNSIAENFDAFVNMYDTKKRIDVVFNEFLIENIQTKKILDAGSGTGWFSQEAFKRGGTVTALDIGPKLLKQVLKKCQVKTLVGSVLNIPVKDKSFDIVISSEVIEHTDNPVLAIYEFSRVLKKGGTLILTTPNRFWFWSVLLANYFHLRPYQGLETWISWQDLRVALKRAGFIIMEEKGIHFFPFVFSYLNKVLDFFHQYQFLKPVMVNMAVKCRKK